MLLENSNHKSRLTMMRIMYMMQKEGRKKQARLHVYVHVVPFTVIPSCKTGKRNVTKVTKPAVVQCTALVLSDSPSLIHRELRAFRKTQ